MSSDSASWLVYAVLENRKLTQMFQMLMQYDITLYCVTTIFDITSSILPDVILFCVTIDLKIMCSILSDYLAVNVNSCMK